MVHQKFKNGDLTWILHDGQKKILNCILNKIEEDEFLVLCSRQLGKSFTSLCIAIMHCAKKYKGKRKPLVRIFCETEKQVDEIVKDNMSLLQQLAPPQFIRHTKSERKFYVGLGEIRVGLLAGARVDGKRGGNATLVITEEGAFSPSETFKYAVDSIIGPQLLRSSGRLIHITTSSTDETHHIHTVIQPKCEQKKTFVNLTIYDNPQIDDGQIIKAFEKIFDGTTEAWQREYLCEIVRSAILTVIPEFTEAVQGKQNIPAHAHWLSVIDFGGVRDKHGVVLGYHDYNRKKDVICAELLLPVNTGTNIIVDKVKEIEAILEHNSFTVNSHSRFIDAPGQIQVDLTAVNFACAGVTKGEGSFDAMIRDLRLGFVNGTLEVWPECEWLIKCLKYGKLNTNRTDFERHPVFGHLDILAAAGYFLRHINRQDPFPYGFGKHSNSHFLNGQKGLTEKDITLQKAFFG
jgi:hypothetical protein